ncbi:MAG: hypothetical protein K9I34_00500 [Bacteroidales bacterium]|nr:hypothetical protein [Bacteroidales bacterium]
MKTFCFTLLILGLIGHYQVRAQSAAEIANSASSFFENPTGLNLNLGMVSIDGEFHLGIRFQPELAIGKFGMGLNVPLMYNIERNEIRTEEFKDGVAWLRLIDYLRWGKKKKDHVYVRVGRLTGAYLGFGILMNNYTNSISFEKRTIGVEFDVQFKKIYGIEGIYSNFDPASFNLFAIRPYIKPLGNTDIPILKTLEVGIGLVTDYDQTKSLFMDDNSQDVATNSYLKDGMTGLSADLGLFLFNNDVFSITTYAQYGRLMKNDLAAGYIQTLNVKSTNFAVDSLLGSYGDGQGFSVGIATRVNLLFKAIQLNARVERLWYTNYFMPQFFDYQYEVNKNEKILALASAEATKGIYGSLVFNMIEKIFVGGGVMIPDVVDATHPAAVFANVHIPDLIPKFYLSAKYYRPGIVKLEDVVKLDEYSNANAIIAYKIMNYLLLGVDYKWTFVPTSDKGLQIHHQVMPYIGFNYPLSFNQ